MIEDTVHWLARAVDALAHEYHWSLHDILYNTYPDQLKTLLPLIEERKVKEYKMALAISQNHATKDPKLLWKALDTMHAPKPQVLDVASFDRLKNTLTKGSSLVIK